MSTLTCSVCQRDYEPGPTEPWKCEHDHPLEHASVELPDRVRVDHPDPSGRVWDFENMYPETCHVTLGEGNTPEIRSDRWNASFKLEYVSPSASFKDRGTTAMLSRAVDIGVETLVDDSSGNAGSSVAQYAAQAGITAEIYVPAAIPSPKRAAIESVGASVVPVEGSREDVRDACVRAATRGDGWYASHSWRPSFLSGMKSFAYEVAATRQWTAPDAVVLPAGAGTLFIGAYRGFKDLVEMGMIDTLPRLLCGQAAGYAPIADDLHGKRSTKPNELAEGLHTADPPRKSQIHEVIDATDGDAVAVSEEQTRDVLDSLRRAGFYIEPTAAVAPAAHTIYRDRGIVDESDDVVVALSGSGLNSP